MKVKKILRGSLLAAALLLTSAGCSGNSDDGYNLTIWVSENDVSAGVTQTLIDRFNEEYADEGIVINATIEGVSEADAATNMLTDVDAGADLYCFAQDQFARLVQGGALTRLGDSAAATVTEANDAGSVSAVTSGDYLYAYPMTSDNGYFLYYDTSVYSEEDVKDMSTLIAKAKEDGSYISFEMETSAWYEYAFFFGAGVVSEWTTDDDGNFVSVNDTTNSDAGLIAAKGIYEFVTSGVYLSSSSVSDLSASTPSSALVSGTWAYEDAVKILGDNLGACKLPTYTVDGTSYQLGSYSGYKLMGVKPHTDSDVAAVCNLLALYLTNAESQEYRFDQLSWGPSNVTVAAMDKVVENPALAALLDQNQYSVPQGQIHGSWWDIAKVIATNIAATDGSDTALKSCLQTYEDAINALFTMSDEEKNAYTVIGYFAAYADEWGSWATDVAMTNSGDIWTTEAITLTEGDEFKVRQGLSWDVAYPSANYVVSADEAGSHQIQLDASTGTVSII